MGFGVLVLVGVLVAAVSWGMQGPADRTDEAMQVLDRRLATGELTVEEHADRRRVMLEEDRRRTPSRSRSTLLVVVPVVVVLAVLAIVAMGSLSSWGPRDGGWMGGHMGWDRTTGSNSTEVAGARTIEVQAGDLWFEPTTIEVSAGQPVNLTLVNTGAVFHDLTVPAADVVLSAEPGERTSGGLVLSEPGRYEFSCSVPGHAQGGMRGTVVVADAATP